MSVAVLRDALIKLCAHYWTEKPVRVIAQHILELAATGAVPLLMLDVATAVADTETKREHNRNDAKTSMNAHATTLSGLSHDDLTDKRVYGVGYGRDRSTATYRDDLAQLVLTIIDAVLSSPSSDVLLTASLRLAVAGLGSAAPHVLAMLEGGGATDGKEHKYKSDVSDDNNNNKRSQEDDALLFARVDQFIAGEDARVRAAGFLFDQRAHLVNFARLVFTVRHHSSPWAKRQAPWSHIVSAAKPSCRTVADYARTRLVELTTKTAVELGGAAVAAAAAAN